MGSGSQTPSRKKQAAIEDMDSIADMLGGLSVETKRCDMCQTELTTKESSEGAIRCFECETDLKDQALTVKHKEKKSKSHKKKASHAKPLHEKRKQARRVIDDSDDEDEADRAVIDLTFSPAKAYPSPSDTEDEDEYEDDDLYGSESESEPEIDLIASTKIRHLLGLLSESAPTSKIIVFSFFTSMLDLIEPFLHAELPHLRYVRYDGSMRNDAREAALASL
ncbi:MAG: hypothetical protein M1823_007136, partial [Watsoniomyces obsoletus]